MGAGGGYRGRLYPEGGRESVNPDAGPSYGILHPGPAIYGPPMIQSSGINTSLPQFGPFWNTAFRGLWRRPMLTPGVSVRTSAQGMPMSSLSPRRWAGAWSREARPGHVGMGARRM